MLNTLPVFDSVPSRRPLKIAKMARAQPEGPRDSHEAGSEYLRDVLKPYQGDRQHPRQYKYLCSRF